MTTEEMLSWKNWLLLHFPYPIDVFITSWKMKNKYNLFKTIYYYDKIEKKNDLYKIKFVNSALKHNVITNTNINMKPCKCKLWVETWLIWQGSINKIWIWALLKTLKKLPFPINNKINYIAKPDSKNETVLT